MPKNFQGEVDRHCTGWGRRVTWRKMEEKKKPCLWPKERSWNDVNWVLSPQSYLAGVSVLTSGHNLLCRFLWELGKWGGRDKGTRGNFRLQIKALGEARRKGKSKGRGCWLQDWPVAVASRTLPFLRQMDTFLLVVRKRMPNNQACRDSEWKIPEMPWAG
jgi:hypothetical protein